MQLEIGVDIFCPDCGYNLRGLLGDVCPECGGDIAEVRSAQSSINPR